MRRLPLAAIVALGVLLVAPTLTMGFYADDCVHQLALEDGGGPFPMEPWALFDFGSYEDWSQLQDEVGAFPWWTDHDWKARFLRPLSSVYLWGLHGVFGSTPLGYHAVGIALFALLLVLLRGLYRALGLSERAAGLATLLFAVCDSAVLPVGWPANHNALLVALLAVAALRAVCGGGAGRVLAGLGLAAGAALAKESGSAALVLVAVALALRARRADAACARPWLIGGACAAGVLALAHAGLVVGGGYGTNSLFYATPWSEPARFASNLALLFSAGLVSLVAPLPLDAITMFPGLRPAAIVLGALLGVPLWIWIARTLRGAPGTGILAGWGVLFLALQAGVSPSERLLFVPAVGALGLVAMFFDTRWSRDVGEPAPARWSARVVLALATVGSGLSLFVQSAGMAEIASYLHDSALASDVGSPANGQRDVFVLQSESEMQAFTLPLTWAYYAEDREVTFWCLQSANRPVRWTRVDARTFDLESLGAPFLGGSFEGLYLSAPPAVEVGRRWSTRAFSVEALAVEGGRPTRLRVRTQVDLEHPSSRFLRPLDGVLCAIDPPAVGASIELEKAPRSGPFMP